MSSPIERVQLALEEIRQGKMVILTDSPDRENEGDLIIPAETITTEKMNFIIQHTSGIVCLPLLKDRIEQLGLSYMVPPEQNSSARGTPFTLSIDAKNNITTGVSAADRTITVKTAMDDHVRPDQLSKPGHIFPLWAKEGGVLERQGHTEGAIDLARLAGFKPAAVLCELMNKDGTMMRGEALRQFAEQQQLYLLSISDIIQYRLSTENMITETAKTVLPLDLYGSFQLDVIKTQFSDLEHLTLYKKPRANANKEAPLLVRIHSRCTTGDLFGSLRCDCHKQLHYSLKHIGEEGGMLIYLNQEGRGAGLFNKIKAYALQDAGLDTVEANTELGLEADAREYYLAANILRNHHINHVRLLTNNPKKVEGLMTYGIEKVERVSMPAFQNTHNQHYLDTKINKLNHIIDFNRAS